ncbi:MAG TPA: hypothetical protein VGF67_11085 [Ktedonobacteraceae bacterium]
MLDAALFFVCGDSRLIQTLCSREHVGANDPARFAQHLVLKLFLVHSHTCSDLPRLCEGAGIGAGPSSAVVVRVGHHLARRACPCARVPERLLHPFPRHTDDGPGANLSSPLPCVLASRSVAAWRVRTFGEVRCLPDGETPPLASPTSVQH